MMRHNFFKIKTNSIIWFIARYLFRSNKIDVSKRHFPLLALTAILGISLGIMTLIVVMSVMLGFSKEISSRLQGLNAQIILTPKNAELQVPATEDIRKIINQDEVLVDEVIVGEVVIRSSTSENTLATGAEVRGVDNLIYGKGIDYYFAENKTIKDGTVLGNDMLGALAVHPDYFDELEFIAPMASVGISGDLVPNNIKVRLVGAFKSGIYRYDGTIAYIPKKQAIKLLGLQARKEIEIRNIKSNNIFLTAKLLKNNFPNLEIRTWEEMNKRLFSALRLERIAMSAILLLTVIISSFSIAGATSMFVTSKRKDLALLQVLGMKKCDARKIFAGIGIVVGGFGTFFGVFLGCIVSFILSFYPLNLPEVYYLERLPLDINFVYVLFFALFGFLITMVSAWIPVKSSMDETPITVLRYE